VRALKGHVRYPESCVFSLEDYRSAWVCTEGDYRGPRYTRQFGRLNTRFKGDRYWGHRGSTMAWETRT
jgi:hypothetical protein